jgi:hypothetical protein
VRGRFDPGEAEGVVEAVEFGAKVGVADEFGSACAEEEKVFEEEGERAEESGGFLLAFGSGAVGLGHLEEGGVVGLGGAAGGCGGVAEKEECIGAGGGVGGEIEAEGFAAGSLSEACDEAALRGRDVGAAVGEEHLDLFDGQGPEADGGAAGADCREEFAGVFGEDDDVDGFRWLFENLEERVGGFLHEVGGGEDEDLARSFAGEVVGALDEGADLAEFDEKLRGIGGDDEDVGVGLDEDAGLFLVGLAELFTGGDGLVDLFVEVGGGGDAGAVVADAAEGGEGLSVGPEVAGFAFALDGHCEHEGEGVLSGSAGSGKDEGVGKTTGGDGGAKVLDGGGVAEEVVEGGG